MSGFVAIIILRKPRKVHNGILFLLDFPVPWNVLNDIAAEQPLVNSDVTTIIYNIIIKIKM